MVTVTKFENKSQVDAVRNHLKVHSGQMWVNLFDLMVSSNGGELTSLLGLEVEHVRVFLQTGVIVWNVRSKRSNKSTQEICQTVRIALESQLRIAQGCRYLFQSSLTGSNRGSSIERPITRQAAWIKIKRAQDDVRNASLNSGICSKVNISPQSIIGSGVNVGNASAMICEVVAMFGGLISEDFMDAARSEIARLEVMSKLK